MKIKELKINGFGKLEDKEIKFDNCINVVYGENEAGKSTLLKFITGMFYGLSKNKNGQSNPDIEKFEPWNNKEFSGKIKYTLDNQEEFEVYREFKKKNPKIFNHNLEDVSKNYTIDKTKGNRFFYDQTGLEEEIFTSSVITKQGEVKLDSKSQNNIIQKISNILGTGVDNTSYEKILARLKKKMNDEIGTNNTKEKPINVVEKRIAEIEEEKKQLEKYKDEQFQIEEEIKNKKLTLIAVKERLETLRTANIQLEKEKAEETKINVVRNLIEDTNQQMQDLEETNTINHKKTTSKIKKVYKIVEMILIFISILCMVFVENIIIKIIPVLIALILGVYLVILVSRESKKKKEEKKEYKSKLRSLNSNKRVQEEELKRLQDKYEHSIQKICDQYHIQDIDNIIDEINQTETKMNELTLRLHTIEIDHNNVSPKLEKLINLEEEWESLKEDKTTLEKKRDEIKKAIEVLEIAYNKMKEEITPKFTDKLSKTIDKISDGKYKNVRINKLGEIIVEDVNGEYISAENLSMGTIDQLYLALRLATIKEITNEKMPIILDEAFAYYDNDRLKNILEYLSKEYKDNQIIIFTCTKREIEILNKLNMQYHLIEL